MHHLPKDILIIALASIFVMLISSFIIIFIVVYQKRQQKNTKDKENMKFDFQQELLKTQLEIQEATFKNISQEIHDNIGQSLSFIKLNINTIDINSPQLASEKLVESKNLLTKTIQDLRDLSKSLNTDFINDVGLYAAIEQQLKMLQKTGLFTTSISVNGKIIKFDLHKELVIFRIVQELLNNIVKHAEANTIDVQMQYTPNNLNILVTDNGKGFTPPLLNTNEQPEKGIGLYNMINRVGLIGANLQFAKQQQGTVATLTLNKQNNS